MRKQTKVFLALSLLAVLAPMARAASLRERDFTGFPGDRVFAAAVKAARENFVVNRVDTPRMTVVFHTDVTLTHNFDWTASLVKAPEGVKLVLNVPGRPEVLASREGERIAAMLFEATEENLAKENVIECGLPRPVHRKTPAFWKQA